MCETYICEKSITLNPCSEGFYLYLNEDDGLYKVTIFIRNYGSIVRYAQLLDKILYVNFKAIEYVREGTLEIEVEKMTNETVAIPFGTTCTPQCGFSIDLGTSNNELLLNKQCSEAREVAFSIQINEITFTIPINNYTWQIS
jgi:hypothetical protein